MKYLLKYVSAVVMTTAIAAQSCDNKNLPDMMKSAGNLAMDTIEVGAYKDLVINNNFHVELVKGDRDFVVVEYGKNLIENVSVKYDEASSTLSVSDDTKFGMVRNNQSVPKIKCSFSLLCNIYAHASVIISSDDSVDVRNYVFDGFIGGLDVVSNAPELRVEIADGSGSYKIGGRAESLDIEAQYTSIVDASGLRARVAHVANYSTGDVLVNAADTVYAEIHHTGDVCYKTGAIPVLVAKKGKGSFRVID